MCEPSAVIMESLIATQILESINAAIEEWFDGEIGAHEREVDE
jgi:hypothetical protein